MDARQMLAKLDGYGGIIPFNSEELEVTLRALRLLAAAEGGEGAPETDALHHRLVKASEGPQWIAGKDYCDMKDHARTLEQRCNALAARVAELEGRLNWAANELLACDYGDNERGVIAWRVYGWRDAPNPGGRRIWGDSIDAAIDAARSK